jgi:hypothetical protein
VLDQDRQDALDVLDDTLLWELSPGRWSEIEQVVARMTRALAEGDDVSFQEDVYHLELLGPVRAASAGNPPPERAGARVRERINELVRSLTGPDRGRPAGGGRPG